MKILTWNCNQGISNDFSAIKDFDADVVIIQECEKLDKNSLEGYSSHWIGNNDRKGLAVLTKKKSELKNKQFITFKNSFDTFKTRLKTDLDKQ